MEKTIIKIEATRINPDAAQVDIHTDCTGEELIRVLSDIIISLSDSHQRGFTVKNGWWLILNSAICEKLAERTKKR